MSPRRAALMLLFAILVAGPVMAQPYVKRWEASSGQLPDQTCPYWTLVDNSAAVPVLSGGGS